MEGDKILGWTKKDIKSLFLFLKQHPQQALINNITIWANKNFKQPFSVRNFFYKLLKCAKIDEEVYVALKDLGVDLSIYLEDTKTAKTKTLLSKILDYSQKKSVFSVCLELANNDKSLASKFQNKYRNTLANHPEIVKHVIEDLHKKGIPTRHTFAKPNVVLMPQQNNLGLTQNDIQSLVLGVINLIKNDAEKKVLFDHQKEVQQINNNLQKTLIESRRKDVLLKELKIENEKIKKSLEQTKKEQQKQILERNNTFITIKNLFESNKQKALQNYLTTILTNQQQNTP